MLHTEWDHPPPPPKKKVREKKTNLFIWILALFPEGCEVPVMWWGWKLAIGFLDKINLLLFFQMFYISVCVFCGECGCICMISICVDESAVITMNAYEWLHGPYLYDYNLYYTTHQCVIINSNQCECLAISVYVREYSTYNAIFFLSFYYSNYSYCIF